MVKACLGLVLLGVALVNAFPAKVNSPKANYAEAIRRVNDIHYVIINDEVAVNTVAHGDNPDVAVTVARKVRDTGVAAEVVIREMISRLNDEDLTRAEAEEYFGILGQMFADMEHDLLVDLIMLSPNSQETIPMIFLAGTHRANDLSVLLFELLD